MISFEYSCPNGIRNFSIMFRSLPILFKHIDADRQIRIAGIACNDGPAEFRS